MDDRPPLGRLVLTGPVPPEVIQQRDAWRRRAAMHAIPGGGDPTAGPNVTRPNLCAIDGDRVDYEEPAWW